jgi:hypothetical protein
MGRAVAKLADDEYVEWSSITDSPVSWIKTRAEAVEVWSEERVARADKHGDSFQPPDGNVIAGNRAGDNEETLTLDEIRVQYRDPNRGEDG